MRSYGIGAENGEIGLEATPDAYVAEMVAVFREVRRVLRDDATLWLNLGDSYSGGGHGGGGSFEKERNWRNGSGRADGIVDGRGQRNRDGLGRVTGLKPKDLIGIPWRVAFALQQPYYTGIVGNEIDRTWLAAMLDAEGCITASEYETGDRTKSNIYIGITNASVPIIHKCGRLFPQEKENVYQKSTTVNRAVFRWDVERIEEKSLFLREIYPYLIAKQKQAILGYTFVEMQRGLASKKKGYLPEQSEKRSWLVGALQSLNQGGNVDLPDWVVEPPSLFEPGYYLRQDIIWSKPNPMPESVTDRCTKAHEYIFLMSKSARYYYDAEAVAEAVTESTVARMSQPTLTQQAGSSRVPGKTNGTMKAVAPKFGGTKYGDDYDIKDGKRNRRSVWSVATQPFSEAHFATFPPDLIEPCIKAGCPEDGTVLDPFFGAGTTGLVADRLSRNCIGIELNPEYAAMAERRIRGDAGMFAEISA